jgi:hypothetical protein
MEIDDEWQVERRYFSQESMRQLTHPGDLASSLSLASTPLRIAPVR